MKKKYAFLVKLFLVLSALFIIGAKTMNGAGMIIPAIVMLILAGGYFIKYITTDDTENRLEERIKNINQLDK